ncbi:hypothetical protein OWR29_45850 [Actinoplanes sp. Pm04-4]|uniref:Nicastrin n=1 Tax=Paractinoplanes pyxinae TaxID=2997416 RepID=A0ABT4BFP7_9ACTN|nr:hypothetical protein [Actinoplanes pyxinae]MCY1145372.1 hypothetical protein [Actinoplanes pyxinae]
MRALVQRRRYANLTLPQPQQNPGEGWSHHARFWRALPGKHGAADGVVPGAEKAVVTEQQVRDALRDVPAPLSLTEFDSEQEDTGPAPPPFCYDRPIAGGGATDILLNMLTGPKYGPRYQGAEAGADLVLMRIPEAKAAAVADLVGDLSECHVEGYDFKQYSQDGWATAFPLDMGDAAVAIRKVWRNSEEFIKDGLVAGEELIVVSGTWIVFASSNGSERPDTDEGRGEAVRPDLELPSVVRTALKSLDGVAGTNFSRASSGPAPVCSAEALTEQSFTGARAYSVALLTAVHDAACRHDYKWLSQYATPQFFADGKAYGRSGLFGSVGTRPDLDALAQAIEAGPTGSGTRAVYAARGWTFLFEKRFAGVRGFLGQSRQCDSAGTGTDAVCDAAAGRGVAGLDWSPESVAQDCDSGIVDVMQRLYVFNRSKTVPDVLVRSTCRPASTGSLPSDVTLLDGRATTDSSVRVLQTILNKSSAFVLDPLYVRDGILYVVVSRDLKQSGGFGGFTAGLRWDGRRYRQVD